MMAAKLPAITYDSINSIIVEKLLLIVYILLELVSMAAHVAGHMSHIVYLAKLTLSSTPPEYKHFHRSSSYPDTQSLSYSYSLAKLLYSSSENVLFVCFYKLY